MNKQKSGNSQVKSVDKSEAASNNNQEHGAPNEILTVNVEQIRKIQVLEKEIEFWQTKCVDLKVELNNQKVQAYKETDENDDVTRETSRKQYKLENQVTKLQKDLDSAQHQNKSLKMQLADKEKQIQEFEKQTHQHVSEISKLQEKMKQLKEENEEQQSEKQSLETQLAEAKKENTDLQSKETDNTQSPQNAEGFLEAIGDEKDLQEMHRLALMVQGKFMQMYSQQLMENLSSKGGAGGAGAANGGFPMGFPPNAGMMNGFNQQQFGMPGMMPNMQMNGPGNPGMPQMQNQMFANLGQYPHMNPNNNGMIMNNHANQGTF